MKNLYEQLLETAEYVDLKIIPDERCCQLIAWVYEIGGYTEESTHNEKLRTDIFTAQKRLNLLGGETPNIELLPKLKEYLKQLNDFVNEKIEKPKWMVDFENYYEIKKYKG